LSDGPGYEEANMKPDDRPDDPSDHLVAKPTTLHALRRAVEEDPASYASPGLQRLREIGLSGEEIVRVLLFVAETLDR
jgi:hypothetical protein